MIKAHDVIFMSSTLTCVKEGMGYECRLIVDGKRDGSWKVNSVEIISSEGHEIDTDVESSLSAFIATTDDYFSCEEDKNKLLCKGEVTTKTVHKHSSIWGRLFGK